MMALGSTAFEVFFTFTTHYSADIDRRRVLQQEYSPSDNTPRSSLPVGSKCKKISHTRGDDIIHSSIVNYHKVEYVLFSVEEMQKQC